MVHGFSLFCCSIFCFSWGGHKNWQCHQMRVCSEPRRDKPPPVISSGCCSASSVQRRAKDEGKYTKNTKLNLNLQEGAWQQAAPRMRALFVEYVLSRPSKSFTFFHIFAACPHNLLPMDWAYGPQPPA